MKKAFYLSIPALLLVGNLISGCENTTPIPKLPWIERWLSDPICQPPCWEDITPGASTAKEAYEKLAALPDVEQFWMPSERTNSHVLSWEMVGCNGSTWGSVYFDEYPNSKIQWTNLKLGCKENETALQEIIDVFGTPEYAWAEWDSGGCTAKLLNIEKGMIISTYGTGFLMFKKLKSTSVVMQVILFPPKDDLDKTVESITFPHDVEIREWQGYDDPCAW